LVVQASNIEARVALPEGCSYMLAAVSWPSSKSNAYHFQTR
jgi:hypothetical protein